MPEKTKPLNKNQQLIGDSVLDILAERYDLPEYDVLPFVNIGDKIVALDRRSNTASKAVIRIQGTQDKYLVKRFPWYMSNQSLIEFAATFQSNVARQYEKVPEVKRNSDGDIVTAIGSKYYYIQRFVSGGEKYDKNGRNSEVVCGNAGRALAELHSTAEQQVPVPGEHRESVFDLCHGILTILEEEVVEGNEDRISNLDMDSITDYIDYTSARLDELEAKVGSPERVVPVHGDYNPTNLVLKSDDVIGIVDFDNCCVGRPEHDLAEAIVTFSYINYSRNSSRFGEPDDSWKETNAQALLEGYSSRRDVNFEVLPALGETILLELFTLGVVRNDLPLHMAGDLIRFTKNVRERLDKLVNTATSRRSS